MEQDPAINQAPTSEVQTTPKQSNFLVTLLSVLLLISCLIAGFFAWQTQKLVKELRVISDESKPTPTPTSATTIEPIPTLLETPTASSSASSKSLPVACTMEAKICPDGSAVGRSGPKCEFAQCPTPKP